MTAAHVQVLLVYLGFTAAASLLALLRRRDTAQTGSGSLWRKYPLYIFINVIFLAAAWLPRTWNSMPAVLGLLGGLEISAALSANGPGGEGKSSKHQLMHAIGKLSALPLVTAALIFLGAVVAPLAWMNAWLAALLAGLGVLTLSGHPADYGRRALRLAGCLVYLPYCLVCYVWLWQADPGGFRIVFLYLCVAAHDALAQIIGQSFGRRPLAPELSPGKTLEGALGGIFAAAAMGAALASSVGVSLLSGTLLGLLIGIAGLTGDLTASAWKRALGLKNFSGLLGAQGGILDRFDGLIFAAPIFYLFTTWFSVFD